MLNPTDTALATALAERVRDITSKVIVDWSRNGLYTEQYEDVSEVLLEIQKDESYTGDLPEDTTLIEGYAACAMSLTLSGTFSDGKNVVDLFSPYRRDSVFFGKSFIGCSIVWDLNTALPDGGYSISRQFTGVITEINIDPAARTVQISALDNAEKLRSPITLPVFSSYETEIYGPDGEQVSARKINSQSLIDMILRYNGFYQSPPAMQNAKISIPGHGSALCELSRSQTASWNNGIHQTALSRFGTALAMCTDPTTNTSGMYGLLSSVSGTSGKLSNTVGSSMTCQMQIEFGASMTFLGNPFIQQFPIMSVFNNDSGSAFSMPYNRTDFGIDVTGRAYVQIVNNSGTVYGTAYAPAVSSFGWHDVAYAVYFNGASSEVWFRIDGGSTTVVPINLSGLIGEDWHPYSDWTLEYAEFKISNVQVCAPVSYATIASNWYNPLTFVPNSAIDPGLNVLASTPLIESEESWEVLKELVSAEYGVHGFDVFGSYYFKNRANVIRQRLTAEKTISPELNLSTISFSTRSESVRNVIIGRPTPRFQTSGAQDIVFRLEDADADLIAVPGYSDFQFETVQPFSFASTLDPYQMIQYSSADWQIWLDGGGPPTQGFCIINPMTFGDVTAGQVIVTMEQTDKTGRRWICRIQNNAGFNVRFSTGTGTKALNFTWDAVKDAELENLISLSHTQSIGMYGRRTLEMVSNRFTQLKSSSETLASLLLADLKNPIPVINAMDIEHGDPRIVLTDTISFTDELIGGEILAMINGISRVHNSAGIRDVYSIRPYGLPGRWILNHPVYGVLAQTTIVG